MRDSKYFYDKILESRKIASAEYGGNVMPALKMFAQLEVPAEKRAYQGALEMMLTDTNEDIRKFAVTVCIGFFVFSDAIK